MLPDFRGRNRAAIWGRAMGGCCLKWLTRLIWPLVLLLSGCQSASELASLVLPEQRHLDIRDPAQIPSAPLPALPPPVTVSSPQPTSAPKQLSLDDTIRVALANSQVVRILAGTT